MENEKSYHELVLLLCDTTSTFGLVTVADMYFSTRYGIKFSKGRPLSALQQKIDRHAEMYEIL